MGDGSDPVASHGDMVCRDETPTGTALERRKCRSAAEMAQDRQLVREQMIYSTGRPGCPQSDGLPGGGGCTFGPPVPRPITPGSHVRP